LTFRWRLTVTYAALLGLMLLIAGSLSYLALRTTLYSGLDDGLRAVARQQVAQRARVNNEPPADVRAVLDALHRQQPTRLTEFDAQGREAGSGPSRVGFVPQAGISQVGTERVFMLNTPTGWMQASRSDEEVRSALWRILRLELLGAPLMLLLALGLGYVLADRALEPVDQVSDLAARIARGGHPGERVPQAPGGDELARLTRTINDMLSRLDAQLTRERLFAHASGHELRTPISVIRAATSLALEQPRTPEEYRATLWQVRDVSEDMSALIGRLMALAQAVRPASQQPVNLADITLMVSELHAAEAQEKHIHLQVSANDAETSGDFESLVLAAGNLVQNAIKYSPPGSTVHVSCELGVVSACLTVLDPGPGIPGEDLLRLTQPFQRGTHTLGLSGAGLGLALVEAIVEAHGGRLSLTNRPEQGLRAELLLPRADRQRRSERSAAR